MTKALSCRLSGGFRVWRRFRSLLAFEEFVLGCGDFGGDVDVQLLRVELVERRMVLDGGVAAGLGDGGVVDFAVAVAAVADEVDDDVGVEAVAVFGGDGGDADDGVGVLGVDVEDGDGQALGEVGGEAGGVGLLGVGGEAEEVVDDDLDGAADVEAVEGGEDEALGPDALAGEGGVAVDDDGENLCCVPRNRWSRSESARCGPAWRGCGP